MPYCQAYGCSNKKYKEKDGQLRNYFTFPRIEKDKLRLERWLHNIGTGLQAKTFKWSINRTVCSDHFHENCFTSNKMAELLQNERKRVTLREGAVPTLFKHKTYDVINMSGERAEAPSARVQKMENQKVSDNLNFWVLYIDPM